MRESQYARSLIEASLDPLVTISGEGKITDVNEATVKITGVPREKLIGTDFSDYFTEPEKAREGYRQVFAKGFVTDYPLTIRHREARLTDVLYNASVYKDASGNVLGVFAAARDVTAQKQASQYARSLIEASLDPLVTISPEGKITDVNEATIKVTGVERENLIGTDCSDYFTEPEKAREGYQRVFAEGFVTDYPLTIRHRDGHLTDVLYNASVYKDSRCGVQGVFAAARDVTARKRAEEALRLAHDELERRVQERTAELDMANEAIRELSTPVLPVSQGLLIVPMIGAIDPQRAHQLTEQLLRSVRNNRAKVVVLDVTGVSTIDTAVANHLLQTSEAAKLLGAMVIITGISRGIAQTLVELGVDLGQIKTMGDLQSGIEEAFRFLRRRVVPDS
jgi:anti-anti-sigma factor